MMTHIFKLIWNRKRRSMMLMGEILLSFVVLFAVTSAIITGLTRYLEPVGFEYENRWILHFDHGRHMLGDNAQDPDIRATLQRIHAELIAHPDVENVSFISSNHPYSNSMWTTGFEWKGTMHGASIWMVDDAFAEVANLKVLEGRWFAPEDDASPRSVIVITRQMRDEVFGSESPVGQIQIDKDDKKERLIVGVVDNYRYQGEFESHIGGFFDRNIISDTASEISSEAMLTVREGADARVEAALLKRVSAIAPNSTMRIETLSDARQGYIQKNLLGAGVFVAIAGFLILNVALGLFGVLWQSISRRHSEIGLRRAVGASPSDISRQVLLESLVLASIAIAAGVLVAVQVPLLGLDSILAQNGATIPGATYALAMVCGAVLIYLLVSLCALYPSQLAARVQPAAALHDD